MNPLLHLEMLVGFGGSCWERTIFPLNYGCSIAHRGIYPSNHFTPLVSRPWGQGGCQKKQKTSRNSNVLVSAAVFQSELKNLQKRPKLIKKHKKNTISGRKPRNSNSLKFSASFDTHLIPRRAILVDFNLGGW